MSRAMPDFEAEPRASSLRWDSSESIRIGAIAGSFRNVVLMLGHRVSWMPFAQSSSAARGCLG